MDFDSPYFFNQGIPLYYYDSREEYDFVNFGDALSVKIVERMVGHKIKTTFNGHFFAHHREKKLLALGSILHRCEQYDVIWGTGLHGWFLDPTAYKLTHVNIRAVRGPLTRKFLLNYNVPCPEVYGDPALLFPKLFPEFKKSENPKFDYIIIPHMNDWLCCLTDPQVVSPKLEWEEVVARILDSKFVISSSLHGIIIAESFGIPARYLRIDEKEPLFKYMDYYYATNRFDFRIAESVDEALEMGGEPPPVCDLEKLYEAFPFDLFPNSQKKKLF